MGYIKLRLDPKLLRGLLTDVGNRMPADTPATIATYNSEPPEAHLMGFRANASEICALEDLRRYEG